MPEPTFRRWTPAQSIALFSFDLWADVHRFRETSRDDGLADGERFFCLDHGDVVDEDVALETLTKIFLAPALPKHRSYICVCRSDGLLGFLPQFLSFTSPVTSHLFLQLLQAFGRESASGQCAQEDRSTNNVFRIEKNLLLSWFEPLPTVR